MSERTGKVTATIVGISAVCVISLALTFLSQPAIGPQIDASNTRPNSEPEKNRKRPDRGPRGLVRLNRASYRASVSCDGAPVEGASVAATTVRGRNTSIFSSFNPSSPKTDEHGIVDARMYVRATTASGAICEVAAYHPEFGTAYVKIPCEDLWAIDGSVDLSLESEKAVVGVVVDASGEPLEGAYVKLGSMAGRSGSPLLTGLWARTNGRGEFLISGVNFENTPISVNVIYGEGLTDVPRLERENRVSAEYRVTTDHYDEDAKLWDLGELQAVDRPPLFWRQRDVTPKYADYPKVKD